MTTNIKTLMFAFIISPVMMTTCIVAEPIPTIDEILDKYTQTLDSTQSFISEWEKSIVASSNVPELGLRYSNKTTYHKGTFRKDNKGYLYEQSYRWGYVSASRPNAPEDEPAYVMQVIGDTFSYSHNRLLGTEYNGHLTYTEQGRPGWEGRGKDKGYCSYFDHYFMGCVFGIVRLDTILKNADYISLSQQPVTLNDSVCYIVTADTKYGTYKVWFDSEHGYHPAKLQVLVDVGDDIGYPDNPHIITPEEGTRQRYTQDNVRFEKIDDIWVPMEADRTSHITQDKPKIFASDKTHFKRTRFVLNPNHNALGSFTNPMENLTLDPELVNGTVVYWGDGSMCKWQDGQVVNDDGKVVYVASSAQ